nr:transmembrane protein [Rhizobium sp. Q54]
MQGASISRWTMSYFAAALVFLLAGQALLAVGFGYPVKPVEAPETLVIVHLLAVGWLGLLFCGALLQFVPVLVSKPLHAPHLALHALVLLIGGLVLLCCGFIHLAGYVEGGLVLLPIGGLLLATGFTLIAVMVGGTVLQARPVALSARFVGLGLMSLLATAGLGLAFALELSGLTDTGWLHALFPGGLSLHAYFGLIGWMSASAFGVSYRLMTMFLLSPEAERTTSRTALALLAAGIAAAAAILLSLALGRETSVAVHLPLGLAAAAALLFGYDVLTIYRTRKRKSLELNTIMSAGAVAALMLSVLLYLTLVLTGRLQDDIGALVYLVGFGWLSLLGLGQLYKIVAFMTWLEYYGPVLGRRPVPRVQDLVNEQRASGWFYLYAAMVAVAVAFLLAGIAFPVQVAALGQAVAAAGLMVELARTRHLSYVSTEPADSKVRRHPPLFLPNPVERS